MSTMSMPFTRVVSETLGVVEAIVSIPAIVTAVRVVRRNPRDRVMRYEFLAVASLTLAITAGAIYVHFHRTVDPLDLLWPIPLFAPFPIFAGLAGYSAMRNLLRRRKKPLRGDL